MARTGVAGPVQCVVDIGVWSVCRLFRCRYRQYKGAAG